MKALVIHESFFGNTENIARTIGEALSSSMEVEICKVQEFEDKKLEKLDLIIVGSATRAFRPSPATCRFLSHLQACCLEGIKAGAFDTRIPEDKVKSRALLFLMKLFGYAAKPISKKLAKKGAQIIIEPVGFFVNDSEGPLKDGELERAAKWAKQIANLE